jgi:zona occludens toxin
MAITLITGLPGNSKTLYSLRYVIEWAAREGRTVYYSGIKDLKTDDPRLKGTRWIEHDPTKWHEEVPSGSIVVGDEAQKTYRSRSLGTIPPKHVTELEEHRHKGLDFVFITQHPSLVDPAVRKLTQTHMHLVRIWGMEATTVHRWDAVRDNCDKPTARRDSESVKWVFDKSLYGLYHSADVHTMKRRIPGRVKLLVCLPFVVAALGYVAYRSLVKLHDPQAVQQVVQSGLPGSVPAAGAGGVGASPVGAVGSAALDAARSDPRAVLDPVGDARAYAVVRQPRVVGLPETAPRYDALTAPVRVPVPAMCIQIGDGRMASSEIRCKCYSQQGTPMQVELNMCLELANGGRFLDFDPDGGRAADSGAARVVAAGDSRAVAVR